MNDSSRIYIAGHRGLVGSALTRCLTAAGYTNLITRSHADLDLTDQQAVRDFFEQEKPEFVFLAAARVGGIHANNAYPAEFIYQNLMVEANVIHSAYLSGVKKLLFLGSSCIYPKHAPQPMKEEFLLSGLLEPTNEPYAIAKIAGLKMCAAYNRQYGSNFLCVMPTNLYGPKDNFDLGNSHVLPALIRKFHLAKLAMNGDFRGIEEDEAVHGPIPAEVKASLGSESSFRGPAVTIWGTGTPRREFLHCDDLADACLFLMERYDSTAVGDFVNVGSGEDVSISEVAQLVADVVGIEVGVSFDTSRPDGTPRKLLDVSRIHSLGWSHRTGLLDGIVDTYQWYLKSLEPAGTPRHSG